MPKTRRIALALELEYPEPHHQDVFLGVLRYAQERPGWACEIDEHPFYNARRRTTDQVYDGVIARATPNLQQRIQRRGIPLVNVHFQRARQGLAGVYANTGAMGRQAADHLIQRGFKRFGILYNPAFKISESITHSFRDRLDQDHLTYDVCPYQWGEDHDPRYWVGLESLINNWLDTLQPPVALYVEASRMARMICQRARAMGLHVPQDVAVLCQNDVRTILEVPPQISALRGNYEQVGYEAAALLDRLMSGEPVPDTPVLIAPPGIAARESTDHFAVEDELVAQALRYISANLSRKLLVEDIAYELAVSPRKLMMRFKDALNRGVSEEIRRLRLSAVRVQLAEPDLSIEQIAQKTGFAGATTLSHIFKRETGVTPAAYRREVRGENND